MANVIVAFAKPADAERVRTLLIRHGFHVTAACTSATAALQAADRMDGGLLVCGSTFRDMVSMQLREVLPMSFEMLMLSGGSTEEDDAEGVHVMRLPVKAQELLETVAVLEERCERSFRKKKEKKSMRSQAERQQIDAAKRILMQRHGMTEQEAHRYLQKTSMENGSNIVETAQMLLSLMG